MFFSFFDMIILRPANLKELLCHGDSAHISSIALCFFWKMTLKAADPQKLSRHLDFRITFRLACFEGSLFLDGF